MSSQNDCASSDDDELFTYLDTIQQKNASRSQTPNRPKLETRDKHTGDQTEESVSTSPGTVSDSQISDQIGRAISDKDYTNTDITSNEEPDGLDETPKGEVQHQADIDTLKYNENLSYKDRKDEESLIQSTRLNQKEIHENSTCDMCESDTQLEGLSLEDDNNDFVIENENRCKVISSTSNESVQETTSSVSRSQNLQSTENHGSRSRYIMLSEDDFHRLCDLKSVKLPENMSTFENVSKHFISPESSPIKNSVIHRKLEVDKSIVKGSTLLISHIEKGNTSTDTTIDNDDHELSSSEISHTNVESRPVSCINEDTTISQKQEVEPDLSDVEIVFVKLFDDQQPTAKYPLTGLGDVTNVTNVPPISVHLVASPLPKTICPQTHSEVDVQDMHSHHVRSASSIKNLCFEQFDSLMSTDSLHTPTGEGDTVSDTSSDFTATRLNSSRLYTETDLNNLSTMRDVLAQSSMDDCEGMDISTENNHIDEEACKVKTHRNKYRKKKMRTRKDKISTNKDKISTGKHDLSFPTHEDRSTLSTKGKQDSIHFGNNDLNVKLIEEDCESNSKLEEKFVTDCQSEKRSACASQVQVRYERKNDKLTRIVNMTENETAVNLDPAPSDYIVFRVDGSNNLVRCNDSVRKQELESQQKSTILSTSYMNSSTGQEEMFSSDENEDKTFEVENLMQAVESSDSEDMTNYFTGIKNKTNSRDKLDDHCNKSGSSKPGNHGSKLHEENADADSDCSVLDSVAVQADFSDDLEYHVKKTKTLPLKTADVIPPAPKRRGRPPKLKRGRGKTKPEVQKQNNLTEKQPKIKQTDSNKSKPIKNNCTKVTVTPTVLTSKLTKNSCEIDTALDDDQMNCGKLEFVQDPVTQCSKEIKTKIQDNDHEINTPIKLKTLRSRRVKKTEIGTSEKSQPNETIQPPLENVVKTDTRNMEEGNTGMESAATSSTSGKKKRISTEKKRKTKITRTSRQKKIIETESKETNVTIPDDVSTPKLNKNTQKKNEDSQKETESKPSRKRKNSFNPKDVTQISGRKSKKKKFEKAITPTEIKTNVIVQNNQICTQSDETSKPNTVNIKNSNATDTGIEKKVKGKRKYNKKLKTDKHTKLRDKVRLKHKPALLKSCDIAWKQQISEEIFEIESRENRKPVNVKKLIREILEGPEAKEIRMKEMQLNKRKHKRSKHGFGKQDASDSLTSGKSKMLCDSDEAWLSDSSAPSSFPAFIFSEHTAKIITNPTGVNPMVNTIVTSPEKTSTPHKQVPSASPSNPSGVNPMVNTIVSSPEKTSTSSEQVPSASPINPSENPTAVNPMVNTIVTSPEKTITPHKQVPSTSPTNPSENPGDSNSNKPRVSFNESVTKRSLTSPKLAHSPLKGANQGSLLSEGNQVDTDSITPLGIIESTSEVSKGVSTSPTKIPGRLQNSIDKLREMLSRTKAVRNIQFIDIESQCTSSNQN